MVHLALTAGENLGVFLQGGAPGHHAGGPFRYPAELDHSFGQQVHVLFYILIDVVEERNHLARVWLRSPFGLSRFRAFVLFSIDLRQLPADALGRAESRT